MAKKNKVKNKKNIDTTPAVTNNYEDDNMPKKRRTGKKNDRYTSVKWDKLDNTANLFPVIANESVSNVYRISVTLTEDIEPDLLQKALDKILPYFDVFNEKLKKGIFWYYFEANNKPAPRVTPENTYPCLYINQYTNNDYLFRVTYYRKRINLEVFHVLTDGNGAFMFLKELIYQYLRYKYPELKEKAIDSLSTDTSLNKEDSYIKNYRRSAKKTYKTEKAVILKGEKLPFDHFGIIHGYINLDDIKRVSKSYGVTINQYIIGLFTWSVYQEYLKGMPSDKPISTCIPVNLRPYFDSNTMKNFFAVVSAAFKPTKDSYTFEEVLSIIAEGLNEQICKENLEKLLSYNVSNEVNLVIRAVPRIIKNVAMRRIYKASARANTSTITNIGIINIAPEYEPYISAFHVVLSMSKGQNIKGSVCSYKDTLTFTFSAAIRETNIQKCFFRKMVQDGIQVSVESNGVYYE
ncbi:MAG: hypothetical protein ACI4EF_04975 [Coprococcus sp.]